MSKWHLLWAFPFGLFTLYIIVRVIGGAWWRSYFKEANQSFLSFKKTSTKKEEVNEQKT